MNWQLAILTIIFKLLISVFNVKAVAPTVSPTVINEHANLFRESISENEVKFMIKSNSPPEDFLSHAYLKTTMNLTGWNILEVSSNPKKDDETQAYYSGLIEGCITTEFIYQFWYNVRKGYCNKVGEELCKNIYDFTLKNHEWIQNMIKENKNNSEYWWQINLYYKQLQGVFDGYNSCRTDSEFEISYLDFLLLNMDGDLEDIENKFRPKGSPPKKLFKEGRCSAIIKLLPNNEDLYVAHDTWVSYNHLTRMIKKYTLRYHRLPNSNHTIPGETITFSGYPGVINSIDDFYTISSNIAVVETTIGNSNDAIWNYVTPEDSVFEYVRVMLANRLATDGESWTRIFSFLNSGTYNNQWMVIDYNKFKPNQAPKKDLLWILEQIPSYIEAKDMTSLLKKQSYWPSYNVPYFKKVFKLSGHEKLVKKYGDWFSYKGAPRAKIMKRDHTKIHDLDSLMAFMRSNDYKHDPLSRCDCIPPYSPSNAIASRHDLNLDNGTYPFPQLRRRPGGAIDAKLTDSSLIKNLQFIAVSGPTTGTDLPVFKWSTAHFKKEVNHLGQPDEWNFKPILTNWTLVDDQKAESFNNSC